MSTLREKQQLLIIRRNEVRQLEEDIARLSLEEPRQPTPTITERFPIGSTVRLVGRNEKLRLRRKKAVVVDHTKCFVILERRNETFRRAPENLQRINNDEH